MFNLTIRHFLFVVCVVAIAPYSSGQTLVQLGYFPFNGLFAVSGYNDYMLTGAGHLVDVSDPALPQLVGNASIGLGTAVIIDGQHAFFGTGMNPTVKVVDLTIPSAPLVTGSITLPSSAGVFGLARAGNVLYAANAQQGLASIDISNLSSPALIQQLPLSGAQQARGVVVWGDHAYVADGSGLLVVDISDPSDMQVVNGVGSGFVSVTIAENGSRLAVGQSGGGALVFDLTDPADPQVLFGVPEANGTAHTVQIVDDHLYLSSEQFGVRVYLMGSTSASLIGSFNNQANGQTFGAYASNDLIFVTGLVNGAAVLGFVNVGIPEGLQDGAGLLCFPNPVSDELRYVLPEGSTVRYLRIMDPRGRIVLHVPAADGAIDTSQIPDGLYQLEVSCADGRVLSERFVRSTSR